MPSLKPCPSGTLTHDYKRNGVADGQVISMCDGRHPSSERADVSQRQPTTLRQSKPRHILSATTLPRRSTSKCVVGWIVIPDALPPPAVPGLIWSNAPFAKSPRTVFVTALPRCLKSHHRPRHMDSIRVARCSFNKPSSRIRRDASQSVGVFCQRFSDVRYFP